MMKMMMMIPITLYDSIKLAGLVRSGVAKLSESSLAGGLSGERSGPDRSMSER